MKRILAPAALAVLTLLSTLGTAGAQDRLKTMPGYESYQRMAPRIPGSVRLGVVEVAWDPAGKTFDYSVPQGRGADPKRFRFDFATGKAAEIPLRSGELL